MKYLLSTAILITGLLLLTSCGSTDSTQQYSVTLNGTPAEGGSVSPANSVYDEGSSADITATPSDGWRFDHWEGDYSGTSASASFTVDEDKNITGLFVKKEYELTTHTTGQGSVEEQIVQPKSTKYEHGTVVELTATPEEGWKFVEWQGDLSGSENPKQITVESPKDVTAVFEKKEYDLTVQTQGEGAVQEEKVEAKSYKYETMVRLTANPEQGWSFDHWQDDLSGSTNPETITVDQAKTVTAVFTKQTFTLDLQSEGQGSISKSPDQNSYAYGTEVTVTAEPDNGWTLKQWEGDLSGNELSKDIIIDADKTVKAKFAKKTFYFADNGVTIKCEEAYRGETGTVNGTTYTRRSENQITPSNATSTCTSGITNMSRLFSGEDTFNEDIGNWDVSAVTEMRNMFDQAKSFNQDLNSWDVSNVTDMKLMFYDADAFNGDISNWDVSNVTNMSDMFNRADNFNQDISGWNVSAVTNMESMFVRNFKFDQDIGGWDVSHVTDMHTMFALNNSFNQNLSSWDVSNVTDMKLMFSQASSFNGDISSWDVSAVTDMVGMFNEASSFNKDISDWNVSNVTNMASMFSDADSFNQDIGGWDVSSVYKMSSMFRDNDIFNQDIGDWDVSGVKDEAFMRYMFWDATSFKQNLNGWCVEDFDGAPDYFSTGSAFAGMSNLMPDWGAPCSQ